MKKFSPLCSFSLCSSFSSFWVWHKISRKSVAPSFYLSAKLGITKGFLADPDPGSLMFSLKVSIIYSFWSSFLSIKVSNLLSNSFTVLSKTSSILFEQSFFLSASHIYFDATTSLECCDCNWSQLLHRKYIVLQLSKIGLSFAPDTSWQPSQPHFAQRLHLMVSTSVELHSRYSHFEDWIFMFFPLLFLFSCETFLLPSLRVLKL